MLGPQVCIFLVVASCCEAIIKIQYTTVRSDGQTAAYIMKHSDAFQKKMLTLWQFMPLPTEQTGYMFQCITFDHWIP